MKCDRKLPCTKCIRGGRADICEYAPGQEPVSNEPVFENNAAKRPRTDPDSPASSPPVGVQRFDELQARVQQLEHILKLRQAYPSSQTTPQIDSQIESPAFTTTLIRPPPGDGLVWHQPISDIPLLNQVCLHSKFQSWHSDLFSSKLSRILFHHSKETLFPKSCL